MLISYMLQAGMVMVIWMIISFATSWVMYIVYGFSLLLCKDRQRARSIAEQAQKRLSFPRHTDILISTTVELQKTQIFYMMTIQIASLIALQNIQWLQAPTWQALDNNRQLFQTISSSGINPLVFNLYTLRKANKASPYLVVWTTVCIAVSVVTWFRSFQKPTPEHLDATATGLTIEQCGGAAGAPILCCLEGGISTQPGQDSQSLTITLLIQGIFVLEAIAIFDNPADPGAKCNVFAHLRRNLTEAFPKLDSGVWRSVGRGVRRVFFASVDGWLFYCHFTLLSGYCVYGITSYSPAVKTWTLGQLIAITVWVPVFVEYLWLLISKSHVLHSRSSLTDSVVGVQKGFRYRLPTMYHITKDVPEYQTVGSDGDASLAVGSSGTSSMDPMRTSAEELVSLNPRTPYELIHPKTV